MSFLQYSQPASYAFGMSQPQAPSSSVTQPGGPLGGSSQPSLFLQPAAIAAAVAQNDMYAPSQLAAAAANYRSQFGGQQQNAVMMPSSLMSVGSGLKQPAPGSGHSQFCKCSLLVSMLILDTLVDLISVLLVSLRHTVTTNFQALSNNFIGHTVNCLTIFFL